MTNTPEQFLSVKRVGEALGLSGRAVLHRIAKGEIAATKIGEGRTSAYVVTATEVERVKAERAAA